MNLGEWAVKKMIARGYTQKWLKKMVYKCKKDTVAVKNGGGNMDKSQLPETKYDSKGNMIK